MSAQTEVVDSDGLRARARGEIEIEKDILSLIAEGLSSYYIQKYPEKVNLTISEVKDITSGWETELHTFITEFEEILDSLRARKFDEGDK